MHLAIVVLAFLSIASAHSVGHRHLPVHNELYHKRSTDGNCDNVNPFSGRQITADPFWTKNMDGVYDAFITDGDKGNAAKVQQIQQQGATFFWASTIKMLSKCDDAISAARAKKQTTGKSQVVGLVVYNVPNRDCSAGESSGELSIDNNGLDKYKNDFIKPLKNKLASAPDVKFTLVIEPDALANALTSTASGCIKAKPVYEDAIAFAISQLQMPNVSLYLDAGNSGWLGKHNEQYAQIAAKVMEKAKALNSKAKLRGLSTNVANYNPLTASTKYPGKNDATKPVDESTYIKNLSPYLEKVSLPSRFIVDQGRVAMKGVAPSSWCNISPGSFGPLPGSVPPNNTHVDSIVWIKPPGNSDGACGYPGAPIAGTFFRDYVKMLVKNTDL